MAFLAVAQTGDAQTDDPGRVGERRDVALYVQTLEEAEDEVVARVLSTSLAEFVAGYDLEARPLTLASDAPTGTDAGERRISTILGAASDADVVVAAFYFQNNNQLFVQFVLYDPIVEAVLGGLLTRSRQGLTIFAGVESALDDFRPVIERYIAGGYFAEEPEGVVESVRVVGAAEGARVLFVDRVVGSVAAGELFVPFVQYEIGSEIRIEASKPGYHTLEEIRALDDTNVVIDLPEMRRETRFDLGVRWAFGLSQGFGATARFHLVPDTLFVSAEHYRHFEPARDPRARGVQTYEYNVSVGRYLLFGYRSPVRLHVAVGFGAYVSDVDDLGGREYVDWFALVGDPTIEMNLRRLSIYARPDLRYALGVGYNTLGRVWVRTPYGLPPLTVGARLAW